MSKIRSQNTRVEMLVFRELTKRGIYFKKYYKRAVGNPDIALPRKKRAVFIDGDFWHGYNFTALRKRLPKKYWHEKIARNIKRDRMNRVKLRKGGWTVLRVWEHSLNNRKEATIGKVVEFLQEKNKRHGK